MRRQRDWLQTPDDRREAPWTVAYQGTEGAYGHEAAARHFGVERRAVTFRPYRSFRDTLEAVQRGDAQRAMLPIENSTAGSVHEVYDLLFRLNLAMVGEEVLPIRHCLLGVPGATVEGLTHVHSHPQALAQCSEYLAGLDAGRDRGGGEHRAWRRRAWRNAATRRTRPLPATTPVTGTAWSCWRATSPTRPST